MNGTAVMTMSEPLPQVAHRLEEREPIDTQLLRETSWFHGCFTRNWLSTVQEAKAQVYVGTVNAARCRIKELSKTPIQWHFLHVVQLKPTASIAPFLSASYSEDEALAEKWDVVAYRNGSNDSGSISLYLRASALEHLETYRVITWAQYMPSRRKDSLPQGYPIRFHSYLIHQDADQS